MSFDLTAEQQELTQLARRFADEQLAPGAAEWDAEGQFPLEVIKQAGALGFLGLYTPEEQGGLGLSRLTSSLIFEQLATGCTSTTAYMTIHNMALWMIATFGTEAAHADFVADLVEGRKLASYCLTEPEAGSDAAAMKTSARRQGDHYVLNGGKAFISGAGATDVLVVMARNESEQDKTQAPPATAIASFVLPGDADGVSYGQNERKMGWRNQPTRQIFFDQVKVPVTHRLGGERDGFKIAMRGLDGGRINIAACSTGTAQAALDMSLDYIKSRRQFGRIIGDFQALKFRIADMATELIAARQMIRLAAHRLDQQHPEHAALAAMAKRFATDVGFKVCNEALQLHGGYGYLQSLPLERHVRDTRVHQILEGTNEIMRVIISRRLMLAEGLAAFE